MHSFDWITSINALWSQSTPHTPIDASFHSKFERCAFMPINVTQWTSLWSITTNNIVSYQPRTSMKCLQIMWGRDVGRAHATLNQPSSAATGMPTNARAFATLLLVGANLDIVPTQEISTTKTCPVTVKRFPTSEQVVDWSSSGSSWCPKSLPFFRRWFHFHQSSRWGARNLMGIGDSGGFKLKYQF